MKATAFNDEMRDSAARAPPCLIGIPRCADDNPPANKDADAVGIRFSGESLRNRVSRR